MNEIALAELKRLSNMWLLSPNVFKRVAVVWLYYLLAQVLLATTLLVVYYGLQLLLGGATHTPGLMGL